MDLRGAAFLSLEGSPLRACNNPRRATTSRHSCNRVQHAMLLVACSLVKFRHITPDESKCLKQKTHGPWSKKHGNARERCVAA